MLNDNQNVTKVQNPSGVVSKCTLKFSFGSASSEGGQRFFIASEPILIIPSLGNY